jgi:hypothetical protein
VSISVVEGRLAVRRVVVVDVGAIELGAEHLVTPGRPLEVAVSVDGAEALNEAVTAAQDS